MHFSFHWFWPLSPRFSLIGLSIKTWRADLSPRRHECPWNKNERVFLRCPVSKVVDGSMSLHLSKSGGHPVWQFDIKIVSFPFPILREHLSSSAKNKVAQERTYSRTSDWAHNFMALTTFLSTLLDHIPGQNCFAIFDNRCKELDLWSHNMTHFATCKKMLLRGNEISLADASNFEIPFPFRGKGPTNLICFLTSNSHLDDGQSEGCAVKRSLFTHFFPLRS